MLPDAADREWLIGQLALLVDRHGPEPLLSRPLIEPTPAYFPDPWSPDRAGVARVIRRLLVYAGLAHLKVELDLSAAPPSHVELAGTFVSAHHTGAPAWFAGIDDRGVARFGCVDAHLGDPEVLVAHLCHEVAHAWRADHRAVVHDRDEEELLTDLTTVYLGFGIFTVNASFRFRTSSSGTASSWSTQRSGYLPPPHFAYLLAAQAEARGLGWCERRALARKLEGNQAGMFRAAHRALVAPRGYLRFRLGLPSDYAPPPIAL